MWPIISRDAALLDRGHDAPRGRRIMRERLFEQDGLAGLRRGDRRFLVQPVRQADADRVEFGQRQQRVEVVESLARRLPATTAATRAGSRSQTPTSSADRCSA